jgi:hypothetical protein
LRPRAVAAAALALGACRTPEPPPAAPLAARRQDEIVVCGRRIAIGSPVVLWTEPPRYDAYSTELRFPEDPPREPPAGLRYAPGRRVAAAPGESEIAAIAGSPECFDELRERVDLFVLHYDVCGASRQCFKILHDRRRLSVHFLLDVDGTLYQTLDLAETAWHARQANPRSIGVEIAHIGAYRPGSESPLDTWYAEDGLGPFVRYPDWLGDGGVRTPGFVARPARPDRVRGAIHGVEYEQHDFTREQYDALVALAAALCETFPRLAPDAPRDEGGRVRADALSDEELASFHGILGHCHVTADKQDPGPAFDWEVFLERVRARMARAATEPASLPIDP